MAEVRNQEPTIREILNDKLQDIPWLRLILPNSSVGHKSLIAPVGTPKAFDRQLLREQSNMIIAVDNFGGVYGITVHTLLAPGLYDFGSSPDKED